MNKILLLFYSILLITITQAQTPKPTPARPAPPKPGAPVRGSTPYVLKKEYEPQVEQMNAKINSAISSASSARRSVDEKFERLTILDSQMQQVEQILNSASFQIALTSDSLKETRFNMEEFKKNSETKLAGLQEENASLKNLMWILFGGSIMLTLITAGISIMMSGKLKSSIRNELEAAKMNMTDANQTQAKAITDEMQSLKSRIQGDVHSVRADLTVQASREKDSISVQLRQVNERLTEIEGRLKPEDETPLDPELNG